MNNKAQFTPGPIDIPTPCSVCGTRGWILARNDTHGLRIERCDECAIMNDSQAWDTAELFLADLLMRFDEGTNLDKATAAPAMYEALQHAAMSYHHPACKCKGEYSANPELYCTCHVQKAQAALAQAEGKQS